MKCRITGNEMINLFSLGDMYVSDFIKDEKDYEGVQKYELRLQLSPETQSLQLESTVNKNKMYGKYWYRSGINTSMKQELKEIAESCIQLSKLKRTDVFLDIAANDGTLLSYVPSDFTRVGIDPADETYQIELRKHCDVAINDYFSKKVYEERIRKKASIITNIAMFYDLENPVDFLKEVYEVLEDDGLFVIQQSYMPLMIKQLAFDNICHEHVFYHSLYSMEYVLKQACFKIVDVQLNDVNGGSFRLYVQKNKASLKSFGTAPYRDVANMRVESLRAYEKTLNLNDELIYNNFWKNILDLKYDVISKIYELKKEGKKIWLYGASTKGNTLLQWFGLDYKYIDGASERSPSKYGLKTIGTDIPIFSDEDMRNAKPDYLFILPWHFINEFVDRESKYLNDGGHFIVPCPKLEII